MAVNRAQIRVITRELNVAINDVVARVGRNILRELRDTTPVDTGHAASNWIGGFGSPPSGVVGSKQAVTFGPQNASIRSITARRTRVQPLFITNNVDYIGILDTGTSSQAPAGFIELAISRGLVR